jgi:hypothetical protein
LLDTFTAVTINEIDCLYGRGDLDVKARLLDKALPMTEKSAMELHD